jgi:glycosyltransferase involved in cell wall biosynthesis
MKNKIKYISFYDIAENHIENRMSVLAATNKIDYISSSLNRLGYHVEIISPSWTNHQRGFYKSKKITINNDIDLTLFSTFGALKLRFFRIMKYLWTLFQLIIYLMIKTEKNENIMVYHSTILSAPLRFVKKIKHFQLILEVEEIYSKVSPNKTFNRQENKIIEAADKYIFSTEMLNEKLNHKHKPYSVIYGTYQVEEDRGVKFDDGKIHVVYAGTFDPRKGGALAAAAAAEFLPKNYHVHIIGFGTKEQIEKLQATVDSINKKSNATVTYDGLLRGEEYIQFLQKCHVGLSTQNSDAEYNDTSFPSKILSYMANGLRVVTIRIKAIETSAIGDKVYYYDKQTPKDIADAIISVDFNEPYDSRKIIKRLDEKFVEEIRALLKV